jgi:hypothetical protein
MLVRFLLVFARSDYNREGKLLGDLHQRPSEHKKSGACSVEQLLQISRRLSHAVLGPLNSRFTLKQTQRGMLSPDLVHVMAMALKAQNMSQILPAATATATFQA